jgi:hypothetical protein
MFRKLIALALLAAGIAAAIKKRGESEATAPSPAPSSEPAATSEPAAEQPQPAEAAEPEAAEPEADEPTEQQADEPDLEDLAEVRSGQTEDTVESPVVGPDGEEAVIPDVSDDDPLVRQQENAAAADAASIGGEADTVTADVDPELRPVYEGSGDAPETLEKLEEEGR